MKLCTAKTTDVGHGICVSAFWNLGLLGSPLFAEPILFVSHHCMVCVTQELGHQLIFASILIVKRFA